ncbi:MAG: acyl-CoA carboxylase subunit beta [Proteobacteria bacterium]|nr:acyl-CoA carboxylase subunit beta [Pseudomonadota bacterium]
MNPPKSRIDPKSEIYQQQRNGMLALVEQLRALEGRAAAASAASKPAFDKRSALLPRERLARLLDPGAPFLELANLAGYCTEDTDPQSSIPGASVIAGIGVISGVRCMVVANDSGIGAGALSALGGRKIMRCQEIALQNKLPFVQLVESGGANLLTYKVAVVHGSSTAGGAYLPGLSDYVIMVRGRAKAFLAGPPLLKAATGEIATDEDLGGADMHARISGLAEFVAEDDADAIGIARDLLAKINWERAVAPGAVDRPPKLDVDEIAGLMPLTVRKLVDMREVIWRIADDSEFLEFKPAYGRFTVCGLAAIEGHKVGFITNNGPLDPAGATKATQFIQLCCQAQTPLIYLQNTTGYMVGTKSEAGGMIKHGSKMIQAVSNATVPQITVMCGASFGAGNYGMCGRAFNPRFVFSWPNARTAVMGPEQAATTMAIVAEGTAARKGRPVDQPALDRMKQAIVDNFESQMSAFHTSGLLLDDGVIDPRDTRKVLAAALTICAEAQARQVRTIQFGVARP